MTLTEKQMQFVELFLSMESWNERFQYLIDAGSVLPDMPGHLKCEATRIQSCTSRTYFRAFWSGGVIRIEGWSNASIPAGLIAVIKDIFDGCTAGELMGTDINFHTETGLLQNLTEQRKAGLLEMTTRLRMF